MMIDERENNMMNQYLTGILLFKMNYSIRRHMALVLC